MSERLTFSITEVSQVAEVRRQVAATASTHGLNEPAVGKVALVVTEIATNLVKHTTGGQLLVRTLQHEDGNGLEILALDKGPGIANVSECLRDGYSTTGSPGTGLGAIARLSTVFDMYSLPGRGTALLAQIWPEDHRQKFAGRTQEGGNGSSLEIGAVCVAKPGEEVSGDAWAVEQHAGYSLIFVADGLGHGPSAAKAAHKAVRIFHERSTLVPTAILEEVHLALQSTRGAAAAVTVVDASQQVVKFAGVGNIAGEVVAAAGNRKMVSHSGTLGHAMRKTQEFTYPWPTKALLVMHSDGIGTHWTLDAYPGLITRHPSLIAAVLYRDHSRGRDDSTVVVAKNRSHKQ